MKVYDSRLFTFCDLCGEVIVGGTAQVVESQGLVTCQRDLQISHRPCWEESFGLNKRQGSQTITKQ